MMKLLSASLSASLLLWGSAPNVQGAGAPFVFQEEIFNDPEIGIQRWVFDMINVWPVWQQGIFGTGVRVRINDQGVDSQHEEFEGRFDADASCSIYDTWYDTKEEEFAQHGTIVASIIGAAGNNGQCAVGVAPQVTFSSCVVVAAREMDETALDGSFPAYKLDQFDISQSSFGVSTCRTLENTTFLGKFPTMDQCPFTHHYEDTILFFGKENNATHPCKACKFPSTEPDEECAKAASQHCLFFAEYDQEACAELLDELVLGGECSFRPGNPNVLDAMEKGATRGREGKGIIYVHASGNDFGMGGDTNFQQPGRFPIFVGAVGKDAISTSYSAPGASLLLTAPAGDFDDLTQQAAAHAGGGCELVKVGTSFSSPIVSGVIALMLEANPDLTWRDVQGILATTSRPVTHTVFDDETLATNGAGLTHSNLYGFGIVDAFGAVTTAQNWGSYGEEVLVTASWSNMNLKIGDDPDSPVEASLTIPSTASGPSTIVENVEVNLYIRHLSRGHLKITLISPDGTESMLTPGAIPENGQNSGPWTLRTVRSWGEKAEGTWKISIADVTEGDVNKCADLPDWRVEADVLGTVTCGNLEFLTKMHDEGYVRGMNQFLARVLPGCCACGGGSVVGDTCTDESSISRFCEDAERRRWCVDGTLVEGTFPSLFMIEDELGRTPQEACCLLGGGTYYSDPSEFQDQLLGWDLRIYGHEEITTRFGGSVGGGIVGSSTRQPSYSPSTAPSSAPSAIQVAVSLSTSGTFKIFSGVMASVFIATAIALEQLLC